MFRLMWVPKEYKGFSFEKAFNEQLRMSEEIVNTLEEVRELQRILNTKVADLVVLENQLADLSAEERTENLRMIIRFFEEGEFLMLEEV